MRSLNRGLPTVIRPRGVRHALRGARLKPADVLVCTSCGLYQHRGTWHLGPPPLAPRRAGHCPACKRVLAGTPGGFLLVPARFLEPLDEVVGLIRNCEARERPEHPLERLVDVRRSREGLRVTTTGTHLARCIAASLARRFHARARLRFTPGKDELSVDWGG